MPESKPRRSVAVTVEGSNDVFIGSIKTSGYEKSLDINRSTDVKIGSLQSSAASGVPEAAQATHAAGPPVSIGPALSKAEIRNPVGTEHKKWHEKPLGIVWLAAAGAVLAALAIGGLSYYVPGLPIK